MTPVTRYAVMAAALFTSTTAFADTLTAIAAPSGSNVAGVSLIGINNAGWTTGTVRYNDGSGDGFLRAPDGTFSLFNAGYFTQGRALSNANQIIGYSSVPGGDVTQNLEFSRDPATGTITYLTNPSTGALLRGIAQGINDAGAVVGDYRLTIGASPTLRRHGFLLAGGALTDISYLGSAITNIVARGINNAGTIVGFSSGTGEAYVRATDGTMSFFKHPSALDPDSLTILEAVNNNGMALGGYNNADGLGHAFSYDLMTGAFTDINIPGATSVQTFGLNDSGQFVVSSDVGSFIFTPGGPSAPDGSSVFLPVDDGSAPDRSADFNFNVKPGQTYYIDPAFARGFEYLSGTNVDFTSVVLPIGIAPGDSYTLQLWNGTAYYNGGTIQGGVVYNFAGATDRFRIYGIPDSAGINAGNPSGFVTGLTFSGPGTFNGQQISLVPEPAQWALLIGGFGLAGFAGRRRKRFAIA